MVHKVILFMLESAVCLAILTIFYDLVLRKETFFRLNRYFLLFIMVFAMSLPLLNFQYGFDYAGSSGSKSVLVSALANFQSLQSGIIHLDAVIIQAERAGTNITMFQFLVGVYLIGSLLQITFLVRKFYGLIRSIAASEKWRGGKYTFLTKEPPDNHVFSFFHFIFIGADKLNDQRFQPVIEHEKSHAAQWHSLDLLLMELLIVLQWFNPFIYLLRKRVVENHEFLADKAVMHTPVNRESYLKLILNQVINHHYFRMTSGFSNSLSKNRLKMLTTMKSSNKYGKYKLLALLPVAALLIFFFACNTEQDNQSNLKQSVQEKAAKVYLKPDQMPVYDGDKNIAGFRNDVMKNLSYPEEAKEKEIEGTVYIEFKVDEKGEIIDKAVIRGAHPVLDEAALAGLEGLGKWEPGKVDGKPVMTQFTIPIVFALK